MSIRLPDADTHRRKIVAGFFALLLVLGLAIFNDFGVSWDEPEYYEYGHLVSDFLTGGGRGFETFLNLRLYGPVVPIVQAVVANALGLSPENAIPAAHLVNYIIFLAGAVAFYRLCLLQFESWRWSLLATAMLFLSPRIFSHAFVNPKDGPFLAMFTINIYLLVLFLEKRKLFLIPLLGLTTALLIDIRVAGFLMPVLVTASLAADALFASDRRSLKSLLPHLGLYLLVVVPTALALWPFLWPDPIGRLGESMSLMSNFVGGPVVAVYMGKAHDTISLPWHYVPVWIGITTPPAYLVLASAGLVSVFSRNPFALFRAHSKDRHFLLYATWLFAVPLAVIVTGANLYDEWRQVNFIYPGLLIFAIAGARAIYSRLSRLRTFKYLPRVGFVAGLAIVMASVAVRMISLHPYEGLYFNSLAGGGGTAKDNFELDYWGISYKEGLAYLLSHYQGRLKVYACTDPAAHNSILFEDRARLEFVSKENAEFGLCAPRGHFLGYGGRDVHLSEYPTLYSVGRDGATFLYVKDLRER